MCQLGVKTVRLQLVRKNIEIKDVISRKQEVFLFLFLGLVQEKRDSFAIFEKALHLRMRVDHPCVWMGIVTDVLPCNKFYVSTNTTFRTCASDLACFTSRKESLTCK